MITLNKLISRVQRRPKYVALYLRAVRKFQSLSLRQKTMPIVAVGMTSLMVVLYLTSASFLLKSINKIESENTRNSVKEVINLFERKQEDFSTGFTDWSAWDDTYNFIKDGNKYYLKSNLIPEQLAILKVNVALFVNASGHIVFGTGFDYKNMKKTPVPEALREHISANKILLQHSNTKNTKTGIMLLPEGPMLITSQPILTSKGSGPERGRLIFGRYLNADEIENLARTTGLSIVMLQFNDEQMPADLEAVRSSLSGDRSIIVRPLNEQTIAGYALLTDIYGKPALLIRVDIPREIYKQGKNNQRYLLVLLSLLGLVFGTVVQLFVERLVKFQHKQMESEKRYRAVIEQTSDGIYLVDVDSKRILEANAAICNLLGYTQAEFLELTLYDVLPVDREVINYDIHRLLGEKEYLLISDAFNRCKDGSLVNVELSLNLISYDRRKVICAVGRDITDRKRTEAALRNSEAELRGLFAAMSDAIVVYDVEGRCLKIAPTNPDLLYKPGAETIGKTLHEVFERSLADYLLGQIRLALETQQTVSAEYSVKIGEREVWFAANISPIRQDAAVMVARDITERKRAEELLRKSEATNRALLNAIPDLMIRITGDGTYLDAIPAKNFKTWTTRSDMVGKNIYDVLPPEIARQRMYYIEQALSTGETQMYEFELTWEDGSISHQEARIVVSGENEVLVIVREISDRKQAEATIQYQAFHDLLTDLPNRTMFDRQLSTALANARDTETMLAVMFLDMDRFKTINDTLGHAVGDRLLQGFAERVKTCLRESDIVARWGGDEFTVLLPQITSSEDAAKVGQRILAALKRAFYLEGHGKAEETPPLHISSSIGIALYPQDGEDAETLLRNADAALYRAKEHGRNNYRFYKPEMNAQASELLTLENRLHQALERNEFEVYYQPQIHINTGEIIGMEALVRWRHPDLGLVSPAQFIHLAEENGLIVPIGEWVLRTACAQNKTWQNAGLSPLRVAVNLSPRQFQQPNIAARVALMLSETGLDPQYLELEITETTIMQNVDFASEMLRDLQRLGVHISIDDFGTGYSSLGYLKKFPFDKLKIDQSFVRDLKDNPQDIAIISAMITLGRGLNLKVVVEGVETREQLELLRSLQSEEMQGYLFSHPLTAADATNLLQNPSSKNNVYYLARCIGSVKKRET